MKKILVLIFLMSAFTNAFSQKEEKIVFYDDPYVPRTYTITADKIIVEDSENGTTEEIDRSRFFLGDDKYYHFINNDGNENIVFFVNNGNVHSFPLEKVETEDSEKIEEFLASFKKQVEEYDMYFPFHEFGAKYSASSELKEKNTKYEAKNLGTFFLPPDSKEGFAIWDPEHKPWAEGVSGQGINQYIKLKTTAQFSNLSVVNGYVDFYRRDLYKKNSRVKTFRIKDLDNNIEYEVSLKDEANIQTVPLKKTTTNIILYIKDVYKGDKWADTCVSYLSPSY